MQLTTITWALALLNSVRCSARTDYSVPRSCYACNSSEHEDADSIRLIQPEHGFGSPFKVVCDHEYMDGGWIVIQQRFNGIVNFYRGWKDYEDGFGDLREEFWLGLRKIHELTFSNYYELHILLEDWDGFAVKAVYSQFLVTGPEDKYRLKSLGTYSGTAGDGLAYGLNMPFSTFDSGGKWNCAQVYSGAWWYNACHNGNLNGLYVEGKDDNYGSSMCWRFFRGFKYGLKISRMLIRERLHGPKRNCNNQGFDPSPENSVTINPGVVNSDPANPALLAQSPPQR